MQVLPIALQCEIKVTEYWDMTYGEIVDTIKAYEQNKLNTLREQAALNYHLANLIGLSVARLVDKDNKYPPIHEAFPSLFEEPAPIPKEKPKPKQAISPEVAKDRLMRFAEAHNAKRGR